jgi:hypothetical protein
MNWGKGIVIALTLFIGFISFLVVKIMSQDVDLVSEDYYKQEIDYEARIQKEQNGLNNAAKIELIDQEAYVVVQLPDSSSLTNVVLNLKRNENLYVAKIFFRKREIRPYN